MTERDDETQPYPIQPGPTTPPPAGPPSASPTAAGTATATAPPAFIPPEPRRKGRTGFVAGVLVASLVVGAGAGFGGAALWGALDGDSPVGTSPTVSKVVDQGDSDASKGSTQAVAGAVLPSVVMIEVSGSDGAGSGSGVVLSSDGTILTNNHVVELAGQGGTIQVDFNNGDTATAKVLGTDPLTDTAVIKAEDVSDLTPITIGKSSNLDVGEGVVAVGSPFGLDSTVTSGIVSALNRPVNVGSDGQGNATVYPAIQTDAAINPGNSGGALVDMTGSLVGINSSIRSTSSAEGEAGSIGLGFAIPIDEIEPIIKQLSNGETATHAQLGISVSDSSAAGQSQEAPQFGEGQGNFDFGQGQQPDQQPDQQQTQLPDGALVQSVSDGSSASKGGLEKGDVITQVDDQRISNADALIATVRAYRPGDEVTITYVRDGDTKTTKLTLDSDA